MRIRWTLSQIMIATGLLGAVGGLLARYGRSLIPVADALFPPIAVFILLPCGAGYAVYRVSRLRPRDRLGIESATLIALLWLSAMTWNPFNDEEAKCLALARAAAAAPAACQESRDALDREADWFRRRASALRRRGLWLGLTLGPRLRDPAVHGRHALTYELGTAESIEKHEKRLRALIEVGACSGG